MRTTQEMKQIAKQPFLGPLSLIGIPLSGAKLLRRLLQQISKTTIPDIKTEFLPYWERGSIGTLKFHWQCFLSSGNKNKFQHSKRSTYNNRILLLGPSLTAVSGVSTHLNQLLASDLSQNFSIYHFQVGSEGRQEHTIGKLIRLLLSPVGMIRAIKFYDPSLVHLNTSLDKKAFWRDLAYLFTAKLLKRKIVYQVHGGVLEKFANSSRFTDFVLKRILSFPDAIVVLSSIEKQAYQRFARVQTLAMIPNAIDIAEYNISGMSDKRLHRSSGAWQLVYVGRLAEDKGIFDAVEAMHLLRREGWREDVVLLIAGSGPAEARLRTRIKELDLEESVRLVGPLFGEQKRRLWLQADLFVFPTFHDEGLPYAVLESLASGTPLITTRIGGIPEVAHEGVHAAFVEPHRPAQVAQAIKTLLADSERLGKMSTECAIQVQRHYGIARMARQFAELYGQLLEDPA